MNIVEAGPSREANMATRSAGVDQRGQMDWSQEGRKRKIVIWHAKLTHIHCMFESGCLQSVHD